MPQPIARADDADTTLLERVGALHVSVLSDCLDAMGIGDRVLAHRIRPLRQDAQLAGFARTVKLEEVDAPPADPRDYYRLELEAVDALSDGDVMVTSTCPRSYWGELMATACRFRGARGIVADAYARDTRRLIEMGFPTFVAGIQAQDSLGRLDVVEIDGDVECGGVKVQPGDLMVGDHDGVVAVPRAAMVEVIERAEAKVSAEGQMREDLARGLPLREAFATYGIL